jgi:hypothetical protein
MMDVPRTSRRRLSHSEKDGPYLLLRGFQKLLACVNTLAVFKRYGQLDALLQVLDAL